MCPAVHTGYYLKPGSYAGKDTFLECPFWKHDVSCCHSGNPPSPALYSTNDTDISGSSNVNKTMVKPNVFQQCNTMLALMHTTSTKLK